MATCELCTYGEAITTVEYRNVIWKVCEECEVWVDTKGEIENG